MELINHYKRFIEFLNLLLNIKNKPNLVFVKNKNIIYKEKDINIDYIDVNAKFFPEIDTIYINLDYHNIFAIIYEYRHFYQYHQIINSMETLEDKIIIRKWKSNFDNYINFGNEEFYNQDIEIDANSFTLFIIQKLFNRNYYINSKFNKNKVNKYFNLYQKKYSDKEIQDKFKQTGLNKFFLFEIENIEKIEEIKNKHIMSKDGDEKEISYLCKLLKTSRPEQYIYAYIKDIFPSTIRGKKFEWLTWGIEFDIFIPELRLAIEYDGLHYHKEKKLRDEEKNQLAKENNITIFRIREKGLKKTNCDYYIYNYNRTYTI